MSDVATRPKSQPIAYAWMALAATLFALMNFFARLSSQHAHWSVVAAVRALIGAVVAIGIARFRGVSPWLAPSRAMWMRSAFGTAAMGCSFFALSSHYLPLADAVTLNNTTPFFLAILAPYFLGERGGWRVVFALPVSMAGVTLVVRPPLLFGEMSRTTYLADLAQRTVTYRDALGPAAIALTGAMLSAFAMLSLRRASASEQPEAIAAHFSIVAFVTYAIVALLVAERPPWAALPSMLAAGVSAGGAQVAMTRSYALERAARVSGVGYLQVVAGTVLGVTMLHESLSTHAALGITLVISGGLILALFGVLDSRK